MDESVAPLDEHGLNGSTRPKKIAYFYDSDVGNYAYVSGHPMKPHRIRMAHSLIMNYGLYKKMEIYRAKPATRHEMTQFHTDEYVDFLQKVTPDNIDSYVKEQGKYNVGDDCPVFDGLFELCGIAAGGSMEGAARLNRGKCDVAVNWAGGLHHAKKSEASGFCYVNDIVLGIIELLRFHKRVLYIDIDVHHGDGVEEAFYTTDRVMTVSFHKYGEYFPGTGELRDIGVGEGKNHAVNFPLRDGITDRTYKSVFQPVIKAVMDYYQPEAVVLQCGGDSLSGDRLGCFNLSMKGHANCVAYVKSFNLPTLVLGGGGYTMRNVARTWAYETGVLVGQPMDPILPYNEYYEYFSPDYELDVRPSNMDNANSLEYLEKIKYQVIENIKKTAAPSVQLTEIPRKTMAGTDSDDEDAEIDADEDDFPDVRETAFRRDARITREEEYYDESENEELDAEMGIKQQRPKRPRAGSVDSRGNVNGFSNGIRHSTPLNNGVSSQPEGQKEDPDTEMVDVGPEEGVNGAKGGPFGADYPIPSIDGVLPNGVAAGKTESAERASGMNSPRSASAVPEDGGDPDQAMSDVNNDNGPVGPVEEATAVSQDPPVEAAADAPDSKPVVEDEVALPDAPPVDPNAAVEAEDGAEAGVNPDNPEEAAGDNAEMTDIPAEPKPEAGTSTDGPVEVKLEEGRAASISAEPAQTAEAGLAKEEKATTEAQKATEAELPEPAQAMAEPEPEPEPSRTSPPKEGGAEGPAMEASVDRKEV